MRGNPPCVEKKRYRADNPEQMDILNDLEHSFRLIVTENIEMKEFYRIRSYAIPLIKDQKAQDLLNLMCKIYESLVVFYKERLDESVTRDEIIKAVDASDAETLEALSYFHDTHNIWTGWDNGFPYDESSRINISEKVLIKDSISEVLTEFYRQNYVNQQTVYVHTNSEIEIIASDIKPENKKVGRPDSGKDLIAAYDLLKKNDKIDFSLSLKAHERPIQDTVKKLRQSDDVSGTNYKTICKYLGHRFKEDKKSIN